MENKTFLYLYETENQAREEAIIRSKDSEVNYIRKDSDLEDDFGNKYLFRSSQWVKDWKYRGHNFDEISGWENIREKEHRYWLIKALKKQ